MRKRSLMNAAKLRLVAICLFTLLFSGCSDTVSKKEWNEQDVHLVNAINRVGERATDAQDKIRRLEDEISDLKKRIERLERK
jgi:peptidoglycan hydrolase CwlO-like protein